MGEGARGNRGGLFLLGLCLAAGMVISAHLVAKTVERVKLQNQQIAVKGFAERKITSDMAVWRGKFTARASEQVAAFGKLEKDLEQILKYFEGRGVVRGDVGISAVTTIIQYKKTEKGQSTNEIEKYVLERNFEIRSPNVGLVSSLSGQVTSLIKDGVEIVSYNPQYFYTKLNDIKIELLGEATRNAKLRAEQLAENSGSRVGNLKYCSQGVFQITPLYSTVVSDYGTYDTSTIEKAVKAVVTIQYAIRQ